MREIQGDQVRQAIIKHANLAENAPVGVVSSFGKEQRVDEANRLIRVVATTSDIDVEREVVVPGGADTTHFFKLRNIFIDHQYDFAHCVGKLRSAGKQIVNGEQTGWFCNLAIAPLVKSPFADDVLVFAREGGISVSIGFEAYDYGKPTPEEIKKYSRDGKGFRSIVRSWGWAELSVTMFPANLSAQQVGMGQPSEKAAVQAHELIRKRLDLVDSLLCKGQVSKATALAFGFPVKDSEKDSLLERRNGKRLSRIVILDS